MSEPNNAIRRCVFTRCQSRIIIGMISINKNWRLHELITEYLRIVKRLFRRSFVFCRTKSDRLFFLIGRFWWNSNVLLDIIWCRKSILQNRFVVWCKGLVFIIVYVFFYQSISCTSNWSLNLMTDDLLLLSHLKIINSISNTIKKIRRFVFLFLVNDWDKKLWSSI